MAESRRAALSLGANLGDWLGAFGHALRRLSEDPRVALRALSSVYRTRPWGRERQPDFHNVAVLVSTELAPRDLLALCLRLESESGRVRGERWGPRTLDIDVIDYDGEMIDEPDLELPHPRASERAFVLIPLAEIAPDLILGGRRVVDLARACDPAEAALDAAASARLRAELGWSGP